MNVKEKALECADKLLSEIPYELAELELELLRLLFSKAYYQGVAQGAADAHRKESKNEEF